MLQLKTTAGAFKYDRTESLSDLNVMLEHLKSGELSEIRKQLLDYTEALRFLFNKVDELSEDYEVRVALSINISEALWKETFVPDKEINFAACVIGIMDKLGIKSK